MNSELHQDIGGTLIFSNCPHPMQCKEWNSSSSFFLFNATFGTYSPDFRMQKIMNFHELLFPVNWIFLRKILFIHSSNSETLGRMGRRACLLFLCTIVLISEISGLKKWEIRHLESEPRHVVVKEKRKDTVHEMISGENKE